MAIRIDRDRAVSGAAVVALHLFAGWMLFSAATPVLVAQVREGALLAFDVVPPASPPVTEDRATQARGAAAPPDLRAVPKEIVAPPVAVPPPPILAAPVAGTGDAPDAGAAVIAGPGTGLTGAGNGAGSGTGGNGQGGGGTRARLIRGAIVDHDYPASARRSRSGGTVVVQFTVTAKGRATGCRVTRSSGIAALDTTTCKLIESRFRYDPARDAVGQKVPEQRGWRQEWWLEGERQE